MTELQTARGQIFIMSSPRHPQFRFEWHPGTGAVYAVCKGVLPEIGMVVTPRVHDAEHARTAVLAYCNGYDAGAAKPLSPQMELK